MARSSASTIAVDPGGAEAYFQVGSILANELHSGGEATTYLEQGLKISPEDSVALLRSDDWRGRRLHLHSEHSGQVYVERVKVACAEVA